MDLFDELRFEWKEPLPDGFVAAGIVFQSKDLQPWPHQELFVLTEDRKLMKEADEYGTIHYPLSGVVRILGCSGEPGVDAEWHVYDLTFVHGVLKRISTDVQLEQKPVYDPPPDGEYFRKPRRQAPLETFSTGGVLPGWINEMVCSTCGKVALYVDTVGRVAGQPAHIGLVRWYDGRHAVAGEQVRCPHGCWGGTAGRL